MAIIITILSVTLFFHLLFLLALKLADNSIADVGWGLGFVIISLLLLLQANHYSLPFLLAAGLIIAWGIRLSLHIYLRKRGQPEDFRYQSFRQQWGKSVIWRSYLQIFCLQLLLLLIIALPLFLSFNTIVPFSLISLFGTLIAIIGLLCEVLSDSQLALFKANPSNKGKVITHGLWRYSRHPNYFGEATFWWGIALIILPASPPFLWLISPICITLLLRYISGVPMLEKKYRDNQAYQAYAIRTSCFIPWPPKKGEDHAAH